MEINKMIFLEYPKCSTCKKSKKWLDDNKIKYTDRNIAENNPSFEELKEWFANSDLPLKKFFNTSGLKYKALNLKDKLPAMSDEEQLKLLFWFKSKSDGQTQGERLDTVSTAAKNAL